MTFLLASLIALSASAGAAERPKPAASAGERIREIEKEAVPLPAGVVFLLRKRRREHS